MTPTYDFRAMNQRDSQLLVLAVVVVIVILVIVPLTPGARHARAMKLATDHGTVILQKLFTDSRFQNITIRPMSRYGVHIYVSGAVKDDNELIALKGLVQSTIPPLEVKYGISVGVGD